MLFFRSCFTWWSIKYSSIKIVILMEGSSVNVSCLKIRATNLFLLFLRSCFTSWLGLFLMLGKWYFVFYYNICFYYLVIKLIKLNDFVHLFASYFPFHSSIIKFNIIIILSFTIFASKNMFIICMTITFFILFCGIFFNNK